MLSLRGLTQDSAAVTGNESGSILVVDDNGINRDLLSRYLERQGHAVQVAPNGQQALEMIAAGAFDLVLLDITMPGLNGYQVLQHLKNSATWRSSAEPELVPRPETRNQGSGHGDRKHHIRHHHD